MATDQVSSVRADLAAVTIRQTLADAGARLAGQHPQRTADPRGAAGRGTRALGRLATKTMLSGLVNGLASNGGGVVVVRR